MPSRPVWDRSRTRGSSKPGQRHDLSARRRRRQHPNQMGPVPRGRLANRGRSARRSAPLVRAAFANGKSMARGNGLLPASIPLAATTWPRGCVRRARPCASSPTTENCHLSVDVAEPEKVGIDRLLNAVGAIARVASADTPHHYRCRLGGDRRSRGCERDVSRRGDLPRSGSYGSGACSRIPPNCR